MKPMKTSPMLLISLKNSMNLISNLIISTFIITSQGFFGTTTTGETFSQVTLSDHVDVFTLNEKPIWYVCDGEVVQDLKELSICLTK